MEQNLAQEIQDLKKLVYCQTVINNLPFAQDASELVCQELKQLGHVTACRICLSPASEPVGDFVSEKCNTCQNYSNNSEESFDQCLLIPDSATKQIPVKTGSKNHGCIVLKVESDLDPDVTAAIDNFADAIALKIDNKLLNEDLELQKKKLSEILQSQKKIINNVAQLRLISENISDVIWILDPISGKFTYVSPSVEKLRGFTAAEVMAMPAEDSLTPESYRLINTTMNHVMPQFIARGEGIESFISQVDQPCKDGSVVQTEVTTTFLFNQHGKVEILGVSRNITERKHADAIIKTLGKAIEQSPASIVITDEEGKIQFANKHFITFMQYSQDDLKGKFPRIFRPGHTTEEEFENMWKTLKEGKIWECEYKNRKKDKTEFWENVLVSPLMDDEATVTNYILIMEDISEKKKLISDLTLAKEKAEESDRLKSSFLANMSHEIRTPMNGILGFAGLLKEPNLAGEEQQSYINLIEKSGARMLNIINDLITISKVESGQMDVILAVTNINDQLDYLYNFFKTEASQKGLQLLISCPLPFNRAFFTTDREKLFSILTNLIKNALKFTNTGSIEFGYTLVGEFYEFFVKDTGIGIAADKQKIVFDRFVQADSGLSRGYEGAGLGLSISKAYIEILGGKIRMESEAGVGTQVYFSLPVHTRNEIIPHLDEMQVPMKDDKDSIPTILIAEDDDDSLMFLSILLGNMGYKILKVRNGEQAVEMCHNNPAINLILMDIKMPVMDGHSAAIEIKKIRPSLPIIAQTAYALEKEKLKYGEIFSSYLTKPVSAEELKQQINSYL